MSDEQLNCKTLDIAELKLRGFNVYNIAPHQNAVRTYSRKDYFKICLMSCNGIIHYADRSIEINGDALFFGNPHIPYSWEFRDEKRSGFSCLFSEDFLKAGERSDSLQQSPLFKIGGTPVFLPDAGQREFLKGLFQRMIAEQANDYVFKGDLIRNYIHLIIHEAMKLQPSENFTRHKNASSRIASLFFELLERQFPIEDPARPLALRTAQDYAERLSVHVNHLNRAVKETTGKPTTAHISERVVAEAKALLQHTDWNIADIGYSLGFEYPTYFNNYFKRMTGVAPRSLRLQIV